jgi:hypothetical protein
MSDVCDGRIEVLLDEKMWHDVADATHTRKSTF